MSAPPRRRALTTVFVTILLDLIGFGMLLPLLPYYAQELHATPAKIGLLFSSYSLAQLLFAPLLGRLSDRVGRRPVLLVSICGNAAAHLMFAYAHSFGMLVLARSLAGVAANYSIAQAYMADVSSTEDRSKAMGLVGAAFGIGFVLGPALGGMLAGFGPRLVPLTAAGLSTINFVFALLWLPESLPPEVRARPRASWSWFDPAGVARMRHDATLRGLMLLFFLVMFCFALFEATLALYCQHRFDFDRATTSWFFAYVGIVLVVVQGGLLGRLVRKFGERRLILWGIGLMAAGLVALPAASAPVLLAGSLSLLAIGSGIHNPSALGLLSRITDEQSQGGTIGLSRSFGALARTLGPAAGTWIFGAAGAPWPFWTAGALMLVALLVAWGVLSRVALH